MRSNTPRAASEVVGGYPLQAMTPKQALDGSHADHIIGRPTTPYLLQGLSYGVVGKDHTMIRMGLSSVCGKKKAIIQPIAEDRSMSKV